MKVGGGSLMTTLLAAMLAAAALSLFIGYAPLPFSQVVGGLFVGGNDTASVIMREIRLPRMLLGLVAGAALGTSGAVLQGLLRNPLAEPSVTGVSAFAALGAVIAMYFGISTMWPLALPLMAIAGALLSALLLFAVSARDSGVLTLILAGVALSSLAGALTALALNLAPNPYAVSEIVFWLLGSIKDRSLQDFLIAAPFVAVGVAILLTTGRSLDALTLGEDAAQSLGIDMRALARWSALGVALAVGGSVAVTGTIGFVGLVVPHLLRPFVGHQPSKLLVPSAIGAALLITLADIGVRLVPSRAELMLGVFTSLAGAPFFLWLVMRLRREMR
ncbi:MAG: iron chelate uptake ABC transporter family permease subunit [Alphaproteobacteria bacterium]|nr:iron chelate uptake ABC transporter family permease subunit [Alphaproteobacteria bacterium]